MSQENKPVEKKKATMAELSASELEFVVLRRVRTLLLKLDPAARQRVSQYCAAAAADASVSPPVAKDVRQPELFG